MTQTEFLTAKEKSETNNVKKQVTTLKTLCDKSALAPTALRDVEQSINAKKKLESWAD